MTQLYYLVRSLSIKTKMSGLSVRTAIFLFTSHTLIIILFIFIIFFFDFFCTSEFLSCSL